MPRNARIKSETGIYHVILRGINKQPIFHEKEDKERLFKTLKKYKEICKYDFYSYCFMDNHIHLLLKEVVDSISVAVKRISGSYVYWFNQKYERCGHLFQDRFQSEAVEDEQYFLTVLRYIHQNPVKAGIGKNIKDSEWSSYKEYLTTPEIVDIELALNIFSPDRKKAVELFKTFMNEPNNDQCLEVNEKFRLSESDISAILFMNNISEIEQLNELEKPKRDEIIRSLKTVEGMTLRHLAKLTGISKSVLNRI